MKKIIVCIFLGIMLILSSCSEENLLTGFSDIDEVDVTISFNTGRGWDIAKYVVKAIDTNGNTRQNESSVAKLSLKLTKGIWSFSVSAYDSLDNELFRGTKDSIDLTSGIETNFSVMIVKRSGAASINISQYKNAVDSFSSINVFASKLGFETVSKTVNSFEENIIFSDLVQGQWTFTVIAITPSGNVECGTFTGNISASALISLEGTYTTTTVNVPISSTSTTLASPIDGEYYWTNKDNKLGSNKTISDWSDWTSKEQIAQCAAYDDPRTWKGHHEVPYDVYALYAAYDDTNLYIMVELVNMADSRAPFMGHDYARSDNAWWNNRDIPLGFILNTGKSAIAKSPNLENDAGVIWGAINFSDEKGFDWLLYHSSKYGTFAETNTHVGVGTPGFFHTKNNGYFSYDSDYCLSVNAGTTKGTSGMIIKYMRKCAVSSTIYYESTPADNRTTSNQTGEDLMTSSNYKSTTTNDLDMSYWYTIPLSTLNIDKQYIQNNGIGVRQITTNGGSLMDCCPWDVSMVDVASKECPNDDSTSAEKSDVDKITSSQARIGHF